MKGKELLLYSPKGPLVKENLFLLSHTALRMSHSDQPRSLFAQGDELGAKAGPWRGFLCVAEV